MRRVPHPVVVITSNIPPYTPFDSYRGMTVSSFNTVTLTPAPIVSFNVKQPSSTYDAIKASGRFAVHVIHGSNAGAQFAHRFSAGHGKEAFQEAELARDKAEALFSIEPPLVPALGTPPIIRSENVMFVLNCTLLRESVTVGDHVVVLGKVISHSHGLDTRFKGAWTLGLLYVNRFYRKPGEMFDREPQPNNHKREHDNHEPQSEQRTSPEALDFDAPVRRP